MTGLTFAHAIGDQSLESQANWSLDWPHALRGIVFKHPVFLHLLRFSCILVRPRPLLKRCSVKYGSGEITEVNNAVDQILQVYKCISRKAFQVSGADGKGRTIEVQMS